MDLSSNLFILSGDENAPEHLLPLSPSAYPSEEHLQRLLAANPSLLPITDSAPGKPSFLLVKSEAPIDGMYLDLLFIDENAVPTLVEIKRSNDVRIRREVIGQMIDYATSMSEVSAATLAGWFDETVAEKQGGEIPAAVVNPPAIVVEADLPVADTSGEYTEPTPADIALSEFRHEETSIEFWMRAQDNLKSGNVRLVFVADSIPARLAKMIEFINVQMSPAKVYGVEIKQFATTSGQTLLQTRLVQSGQPSDNLPEIKAAQPPVLSTLVEHGSIRDGDEIWLLRSKLSSDIRPESDDDTRLRFVVTLVDDSVKLHYKPNTYLSSPPDILNASMAYDRVRQELDPSFSGPFKAHGVHDCFAIQPGATSLGDLAREYGLWS